MTDEPLAVHLVEGEWSEVGVKWEKGEEGEETREGSIPSLVPRPDQLKNTIPRARTIGDVISAHAHT